MPRGKSYVNNNRGVSMKAHSKEKRMQQCFYGAGCTRTDCIYRHDGPASPGGKKNSNEPCMAHLAGVCTFSAQGCRKRHVGKTEAEELRIKYSKMKCRYGGKCKTKGCLYIHPDNNDKDGEKLVDSNNSDFPPLTSNSTPSTPTPLPNSAWGPNRSHVVSNVTPPPPLPVAPPPQGEWYAEYGYGDGVVPPPPPQEAQQFGFDPYSGGYPRSFSTNDAMMQAPPMAYPQDPYGRSHSMGPVALNIDAKEFVPGSST